MSHIHTAVERLAEQLAGICIAALKEHGVHLEHGGRTYDDLFRVMEDIARPKAR